MTWTPAGDDTQLSIGLSRVDCTDFPTLGVLQIVLGLSTDLGATESDLTATDARMLAAALICAAERVEQQQARAAL
jgi:hypothetical protein